MAIECKTDQHVTCHRYKPSLRPESHTDQHAALMNKPSNILDDIFVDYAVKNKRKFPVYSSMFDGIKTDTYM